jgi:2-polyprenyl-6-methoxyphenol hydroxylase-like FAD-dependent oxidoreductase
VRIAINGAGIAGPTLAWWLRKSGHDVLLVEQASRLRRGGYIIDFWGAGYDIAEKMGILPRLRELGYQVREVRFVDCAGRTRSGFSADVFGRMTGGRFTSLLRSDLSATIYQALHGVEVIFGDSIATIQDEGEAVRIGLSGGASRLVDLVVGADGQHSAVRRHRFGPEGAFIVPLGYHVAAIEIAGYHPRDELVYVSHAVPGRQVSRFAMRGDRTLVLFVFRDEAIPQGSLADPRRVLRQVFGDVGWECPAMLDALDQVDEVYFDQVSQIRMDRWITGRTALVGDAAACVSLLAGEGCGLAMLEAYILAGELAVAGDDWALGLARYEKRLRGFLRQKQRSAERFAPAFVPRTRRGIAFRHLVTRLLRLPPIAEYFIGRELRDRIDIPEYRFD